MVRPLLPDDLWDDIAPLGDFLPVSLPTLTARSSRSKPFIAVTSASYTTSRDPTDAKSDVIRKEMLARLRDEHDLTVGTSTRWGGLAAQGLFWKKRRPVNGTASMVMAGRWVPVRGPEVE
ncbi:hypothetical protein ASF34_10160 [Methylobacterium sp. Leaf106]|nr:hypothetical protein ASF34_10160 [Methylobacterium sp. Leaf106]